MSNLTQENIRILESQYCTSCMINNLNENCWALLELVKEVRLDKICGVYEDRCNIELFKKLNKSIGKVICMFNNEKTNSTTNVNNLSNSTSIKILMCFNTLKKK